MKLEEIGLGKEVKPSIIPIAVGAVIFPLSTILWILNYVFGFVSTASTAEDHITPGRWFMTIFLPVLLTFYGLRKKSLSMSGAVFAFFVGFFLTISSYCFLMCLMIFFLSSSRATKFRAGQKKKIETDFKEGGQRNWIQVICNGGMATQLAILYILDVGYGERPIDFIKDYRASWLGIGVLGSLACANGDTWASELGTVIKTTAPRLITTLKKVPKGTNGGVTVGGLIFSTLGGLVVGLGYYLVMLFVLDSAILARSPPQWPLLIVGSIGGLLGSVIDSILGALVQFSGVDSKGKVHEIPGPGIKKVSGFCLLDNHSVNLISTILTSLILPKISLLVWSFIQPEMLRAHHS